MKTEKEPFVNAIRQYIEGENFFTGFLVGSVPTDQSTAAVKEAKQNHIKTMENIASLVNSICLCQNCDLGRSRKNAVPGEGSERANLMFVGEAPGKEEDQEGRPFVGPAGQLLGKIITACGLQRSDVYIANTLKCRPPGNRDPLPSEIECCLPFLQQQIDLISPKIIVALGAHAARTLTGSDLGIGKLRGKFHPCVLVPEDKCVLVMPTYHPAYLLRNYSTENRRRVWEDMKRVMEKLELPIP